MAVINTDTLSQRAKEVIKTLLCKAVFPDESRPVRDELEGIQNSLCDVVTEEFEVIGKPKACNNWTGPMETLKVRPKNKKRH